MGGKKKEFHARFQDFHGRICLLNNGLAREAFRVRILTPIGKRARARGVEREIVYRFSHRQLWGASKRKRGDRGSHVATFFNSSAHPHRLAES